MKESRKPDITYKAVALEYHDNAELPKLSAKGAGYIAERIIEIAKANEIPITQDTSLTETLSQLQVGVELGSESAELLLDALCFLYHIEQEFDEELEA